MQKGEAIPLAAFSSSEQLRGPSGRKAAPGTYSNDIELDFMVMPLACSSSLLSRYRISPTSLGWIKPFEAMRWSERVVLPWSTCAKMQMFRIRACQEP